jgi:UDP-N-acetylglucosamine diphosphorylase/glucosamine-1-phosphate N-acetyltransferase
LRVLIFEDDSYDSLYPLSTLRGVFEIKCGIFTLKEKIENILGGKYEISLHCRTQLTKHLSEIFPDYSINCLYNDDYLFLNGRVVFGDGSLKRIINKLPENSLVVEDQTVIAAKISKKKISSLKSRIEDTVNDNTLSSKDFSELEIVNRKDIFSGNSDSFYVLIFSWDVLKIFNETLSEELLYLLKKKRTVLKKFRGVSFINEKKIEISKGVNVYPNVVLDAGSGGIHIDEGTTIEPFSYVKGPVYIGKDCMVKSGTKLYGPCSIGKHSKVSGEISHSLFHSYVNKQHAGFFGHSYVGEFVNIGAETTTSNLKNNYSKIKVQFRGNIVNTGMQFLGSIVGDHTKLGINTLINTGTIIGVFSNIAGGGFQHKEVKPFSWNIFGRSAANYDIEQAIDTARIVMKRRNMEMSLNLEKLIRSVYNNFNL